MKNLILGLAMFFLVGSIVAEDNQGSSDPKELVQARTTYKNQIKASDEPITRKYLQQLDEMKKRLGGKGDATGAMAVQKEIDSLKGDAGTSKKEKVTDDEKIDTSDISIPGKPNKDEWISKNATYTVSSEHLPSSPKLLTGDCSEEFAFSTKNKATSGEIPWLVVDLGEVFTIKRIEIQNRPNEGSYLRLKDAVISFSTDSKEWIKVDTLSKLNDRSKSFINTIKIPNKQARYIKITNPSGEYLHLKSLKIFGT